MSAILGGHPDEVPLTDDERKAIRAMNRLAKTWPKSLWLFSASGTLTIMRKDATGTRAGDGDGVDQAFAVDTVDIQNDGGDW